MKTILCLFVSMTWFNAIASPTIFVVGAAGQQQSKIYEMYAEHYAEALKINGSVVLIDVSCPLIWRYKGLTNCESFTVDDEPVYCIRINGNLSLNEKLKTLAHEMIHAQQYNHGLLKRMGGLAYRWKEGKTYNLASVGYGFRPWEMDAFRRQNFIYQRARRKVKKMMKQQP